MLGRVALYLKTVPNTCFHEKKAHAGSQEVFAHMSLPPSRGQGAWTAVSLVLNLPASSAGTSKNPTFQEHTLMLISIDTGRKRRKRKGKEER